MEISIKHSASIYELIEKWNQFKPILYLTDIKQTHRQWNKNGLITYDIQGIVIGKTGYGKSTTLNKIIGKNVFETSAINSTTLDMQCVDWLIDPYYNYYFSIADLPGIGQNNNVDKKHLEWYKRILGKSDFIIYILRADTRDYSYDIKTLEDLNIDENKLIFGLNFCDKIEPINRSISKNITMEQKENIKKKLKLFQNYLISKTLV